MCFETLFVYFYLTVYHHQCIENFYHEVLIVACLEMMQSFDHGYYLLVKSIQELREKKEGLVTVGIGGPSGSGKTRYA